MNLLHTTTKCCVVCNHKNKIWNIKKEEKEEAPLFSLHYLRNIKTKVQDKTSPTFVVISLTLFFQNSLNSFQ